ncbi:M6 family metalloprotease domain-containing protein [Bacteroidota bacterium]
MKKFTNLLVISLVTVSTVFSAYVKNVPKTIYQPDGEKIECFITGDEFYSYLHDANGYTIIQASNGYYYYGIRKGEYVFPSEFLVNKINPESVGLKKYATISKRAYYEKVERFNEKIVSKNAPNTGTIQNLNIFIRFSNEDEFTEPRSYFDTFFNAEDTFSLKDYYDEVSYNSLEILTTHYPTTENDINISYQDSHPRNYFKPYNDGANPEGYELSERVEREHTLLKNAINFVESQIPSNLIIDSNEDGYVDHICFIINGSVSPGGGILWPHMMVLSTVNVTIHSKRAYGYMIILNDSHYYHAGVICHEFFHALGAPDLYHYINNEAPIPVQNWDLMASVYEYPPSMCMFMKYKYGKWIDEIPEITESGDYTLYPLSSEAQNVFKIASPYSFNEYFVIDYRKKEGLYESNTPGSWSGIVVYRIIDNAQGNEGGPPDEIYIYRPNGTLDIGGQIHNAPFSFESGRTEINDDTNPFSFLYNNGNGGEGGLNISNIGTSGDSINFHVEILSLIPPSELSYAAGDGSVYLTWEKPITSYPDSYNIYRNEEIISNIITLEYTDTTVINDTAYRYKVTAVYIGNPEGESEATNTIVVIPQGPMTLPFEIDFENGIENCIIDNSNDSWQFGNNEEFGFTWLTGNNGYYIGINSAGADPNTNVQGYAVTPRLKLNEYNFVNVSFDYAFKTLQDNEDFILKYRISPIHPFVSLLELEPCSSWKNISFDLPASVLHEGIQLAFYYNDNTVYGYGAAFDNLSISEESEISNPSFEANFTEICENELLILTNNSTGTNHEYLWDFGYGAIPENSTEFGPIEIYYNSDGYKTISLTIDNNETKIMSNYIFVDDIPDARINFAVSGPTVNYFTPTIAESYFWDFGDGATTSDRDHTHTYEMTGTYLAKLTITTPCGEDSDSVNISVTTNDIDYSSDEHSITVFPNPGDGNFTITSNNINNSIKEIHIYNLSGKIVYSEEINANAYTINLNNIKDGIYTLKIYSETGIGFKKILVKNN